MSQGDVPFQLCACDGSARRSQGSIEVEVGPREFLVHPGPAARREVEAVLRHFGGPHADEVEEAGVGEPARRVGGVRDGDRYGDDREFVGSSALFGAQV